LNHKDNIIKSFSTSLPDYLKDVETPSGKLFYDLVWHQIELHLTRSKKEVLDIGCGFGLSSIYMAKCGHLVTGLDITPEMIEAAKQKAKNEEADITFIVGGFDEMPELLGDRKYDWILCHNVLGYVEDIYDVLEKLTNRLKPGGFISIITHNPAANVLKKAVIEGQFSQAEQTIHQAEEYNPLIRTYVKQFTHTAFSQWFARLNLEFTSYYGIRCVYDYLKSEDSVLGSERFNQLSSLERSLGKLSPYRDIAFFTHYVVKKGV
jgi:S-adenosylmethionine-dependent methyltransferase